MQLIVHDDFLPFLLLLTSGGVVLLHLLDAFRDCDLQEKHIYYNLQHPIQNYDFVFAITRDCHHHCH